MIQFKYTDATETTSKDTGVYTKVIANSSAPAVIKLLGNRYYSEFNIGEYLLNDVQVIGKSNCTLTIEANPEEATFVKLVPDISVTSNLVNTKLGPIHCKYPLRITVSPASGSNVKLFIFVAIREVSKGA